MSAPTKGIYVSTGSRSARKKPKKADVFDSMAAEPWYDGFHTVWKSLKEKLEKLNREISMKLVEDITCFMNNYEYVVESIPAVALYTGTNLSDHDGLFNTISAEIQKKVFCRVVLLHPSQEISCKYLLGSMIYGFIFGKDAQFDVEELQSNDELARLKTPTKKLAYTMSHLLRWYDGSFAPKSDKNGRPYLVIVIPDIEAFSVSILRQFLKTLSVFKHRLPLMLVFGVATSFQEISHRLSYEVLAKYTLHVFQSQSSTVFLNNVLEKVFLNSNCPFQLGNKVFNFLTDMFLFYNFSVETFIRGIKFCLMNHFFESNINILCCPSENIHVVVESLKKSQQMVISELPSVVKYKRRNDMDMKKILKHQEIEKLLNELHEHMSAFYVAVRCLHALSISLPDSPLGVHIRQIYTLSVSSDITKMEEFKKCFDLLQHLSKDALLEKLDVLINVLSTHKSVSPMKNVRQKLRDFRDLIEKSDIQSIIDTSTSNPSEVSPTEKKNMNGATFRSRGVLLEVLRNRSHSKILTEFEKNKREFLSFLSGEFFKNFLKPSSDFPLSEIMIYDQVNVLRGAFDCIPRAALDIAMRDPHYFLQCNCCEIINKGDILNTFPDLCVAYKLHLECGKEVNLYDWLQAFNIKVDEDADSVECDQIDPRIHKWCFTDVVRLDEIHGIAFVHFGKGKNNFTRFLQTVKDLQFLGFIAPSKRKVDHVIKLKI